MSLARLLGGIAVALLAAAPAWADAIDGNWCFAAKQLAIRGPAIVTPGGTAMQGDYDRHHFSYVVPAGEANAGKTVVMVLLGETAMHLSVGTSATEAAKATPELWRRCSATTS